MTKVIRWEKLAKLLGWNNCEKGFLPPVPSLVHKNNVHSLIALPFLPFSKMNFALNQTFSGHDYRDERLAWIQA